MSFTQARNGEPSDRRSSSPPDSTYRQEDDGDDDDNGLPAAASDWDLDTDDVRSISSSDLYEARPNRWRGPRSTWRELTEPDRLDHEALVSLRNQDLAVHLYNAFMLKQRRRLGKGHDAAADEEDEEGDVDIDAVTGERVRDTAWVPPKSWTAWPMRAHLVPREGLALGPPPPVNDALEAYTVRPAPLAGEQSTASPQSILEELLCADMLRVAKERFRHRQARGEIDGGDNLLGRDGQGDEDEPGESEENEWGRDREPPSSQPPSSPPRPPSGDPDQAPSPRLTSRQRAEARRTYMPAVSADDEASYALLRPAARRVLDMLDGVLLRLHDCRLRMTNGMSSDESSSASSGAESYGTRYLSSGTSKDGRGKNKEKKKKRRRMGRPRSEMPIIAPEPEPKPDFGAGGKRRVGRPRKPPALPLPGESEREFKIRIARQNHQRILVPSSSDPERAQDDEDEDDNNGDDTKTATDGGAMADDEKVRPATRLRKPIIRREGETDQEYRYRVARERHLKLPQSLPRKEETVHDATDVDVDMGNKSDEPPESPDVRKPGQGGKEHTGEKAGEEPGESAEEAAKRKIRIKQNIMARWPLRNWGDVVGAAALTGFPPSAVARATQRCANLFGQSMEMHTIVEVPAAAAAAGGKRRRTNTRRAKVLNHAGDGGVRTTVYRPGAALSDPSLSSGSGSEADGEAAGGGRRRASSRTRMKRLHTLSRASSAGPPFSDDEQDVADAPLLAQNPSKPWSAAAAATTASAAGTPQRSNSQPSTPAAVSMRAAVANACPHAGCPRSVKGFSRAANLVRHMVLIHGEHMKRSTSRTRSSSRGRKNRTVTSRGDGEATEGEEHDDDDEDDDGRHSDYSGDEMDGAVHVDGFLQPIKIRPGWRSQDTHQRFRMPKSISRSRARRSGDEMEL